MIKFFKKNYIVSNWHKIRETLFLLLLFSHIMLRIYNISQIVLYDIIPRFDLFTTILENYGFPAIVLALYLINLAIDKTYFKAKFEIIKIIFFIICAIVSTEHINCLILGAFMLCSDFTSIKKISIVSAAAIFFGTLCVICISQTGWIVDRLSFRLGRYSHNFGFGHYAIWARQILFASILYLVFKANRISLPELGLFAIFQYIIFYYSTQRLSFVISILAVIIFTIFIKYKIIKINNKVIRALSVIFFPTAITGTIWISSAYDNSNIILTKINSILSNRLALQKQTLELFNIKLFGQQVHHITDFYFYIDNGYLYSLYAFGILLTVIIIIVFSYMIWRSCKTNNTEIFSFLFIVGIYLLIDNPVCDMTCIGIAFLFFPILLREHLTEKSLI